MQRRDFLKKAAGAAASISFLKHYSNSEAFASAPTLQRVMFGSCANQKTKQPIWDPMAQLNPDLFIFLGDNVYGDSDDLTVLRQAYRDLNTVPQFTSFRRHTPIIATWDDHDMGRNDAGREYPLKEESKKLMLDFFREPLDSPRRQREGLYTSYYFGKPPHQTQVILLDLRWFRSPLACDANGNYIANETPGSCLLGEVQWQWLEQELARPADFRILGSSIQFAARDHRWEKWSNFPGDKLRMLDLIDRLNINNMVVISGDMHFAELSQETTPNGRLIYDFTSSGLNHFDSAVNIPNGNRLKIYDQGENFGCLEIDWRRKSVGLVCRDGKGEIQFSSQIAIGA